VPKLDIPRQHREGLSKILALRADLFEHLVAELAAQRAGMDLAQLTAIPEVSQADLDAIISALIALYIDRRSSNASLDAFVNDVSEAIEFFNPIGGSEDSKLRLRRVLRTEPLAISSKADAASAPTHASSDPLIYDDRSIVWVASHSEELAARFPNQWILVEGACVIASSTNPLELEELAQKHKIKTPFITTVVPASQPQRMVYARQVI
jgi:hypothetical protein